MENPIEYLERTRRSVEYFLDGIQSYISVLQEKAVPIFVFEGTLDDESSFQAASEQWFRENEAAFAERHKLEERYFAESFAQANLCGALLQVAYMGISLYGESQQHAELSGNVLKGKYSQFSVGRTIRTLPQGLLVLAGRNQYMHLEDSDLRFPNDVIFETLSTHNDLNQAITYRDPAFDLANRRIFSFSTNVTAIMNWRSYSSYERDMKEMLRVDR